MSSDKVSFGYEDIEASEKKGRVGEIFTNVAQNYDIMNDAMTAGTHRLWKNQFVRRVNPKSNEDILDVAGGTGDIAFRMLPSGANITVSDINSDMLEVGMQRSVKKGYDGLVWSEQNAESLNFPDQHFDVYTIVFGIRNVTYIDKALAEAHRVLRYGGRFFCMEFSQTEWPIFDKIYDQYSHNILPKIGKVVSNDEGSYRYLAESIARFPNMQKFETMIKNAGFTQTKVEPIMGGLVAIHSGWKT